MTQPLFSDRIAGSLASIAPLLRIQMDPVWAQRLDDPEASDFGFGNPQEMPLTGFVQALQKWVVPQNKDWFAYKMSEPAAQAAVAAALRERRGEAFEADDICLTNGAFAGLAVVLAAVTNPGDEVIFNSPPWFFYESLILSYSAKPVRVKIDPESFDLDVAAIAAAITRRTRAIIVNSPNNPTGRIYPLETLKKLAEILTEASERNGRPIYLLSDEAYHRIVFDNQPYYSPTTYYSNSFLIYTYGKQLLTPGQRVGYIALPPAMRRREDMRLALLGAQVLTGYAFPNALLQYSIPDLEKVSIDMAQYQRKRDWMVKELQAQGYETRAPEGTFYLLVKSPIADDEAFVRSLVKRKVFCLPGAVFEMPGYFRISLTANETMIERSLPIFAEVIEMVGQGVPIFE